MIHQLVTHDGKFHADETFSTLILSGLFPSAQILRSRDVALITPAEGRIVYDVGGAYDHDFMAYDHHQAGAPVREDGVPYSSFGLIWMHYGKEWLEQVARVDPDDVTSVYTALDRSFVKDIDALDNGVTLAGASSSLNLTRLIENFSPDFDSNTENGMEEAFFESLLTMRTIFEHHVRTVSAKVRAARIVTDILKNHDGGPVLELPYGMPWEGPIRKMGADHIMFTIIPRNEEWSLSAVRVKPGAFENKVDLPEAWGGLTGDELVSVSGIEGAKFVHKACFYAVAETREAVLKMADAALAAVRVDAEASTTPEI